MRGKPCSRRMIPRTESRNPPTMYPLSPLLVPYHLFHRVPLSAVALGLRSVARKNPYILPVRAQNRVRHTRLLVSSSPRAATHAPILSREEVGEEAPQGLLPGTILIAR